MRKYILPGLLLLAIQVTTEAQFTLTPQVGFDLSKTNVTINDLQSFSPMGVQFSPQVMMRMDYRFKKGHGPFVGIGTNRSAVSFNFSNPELAATDFSSFRENMMLRIDAGYQIRSKPISLNKQASSHAAYRHKPSPHSKTKQYHAENRSNCYSKKSDYSYRSSKCGGEKKKLHEEKSEYTEKVVEKKMVVKKNNDKSYLRLHQFAGLSFIPSPLSTFTTQGQGNQSTYMYKAGNWRTAFMTGMSVEVGKRNRQPVIFTLQFMSGLGNLSENELVTVSGNKTTRTTFSSANTSWSFTAGLPISLSRKPAVKKDSEKKKSCEEKYIKRVIHCYQYKQSIRKI